jgi:Protein of unknown function (DUF2752)
MAGRNYFREHLLLTAALAVAAAGGLMLAVFDPATSGVFPPCPVHYLTGWYCPGCGSLRAFHQLLHGHLRAAWAMNPLTVVLLPFLAYGLAAHVLHELQGAGSPGAGSRTTGLRTIRLPELFLPAMWIRALGAAIILFGIVRNIPLHPFNLLAPGAMLRF